MVLPGAKGGGGQPRADMALLFRAHPAGGLLHGAHAALRQHRVPVPHRVVHSDAQGVRPVSTIPFTLPVPYTTYTDSLFRSEQAACRCRSLKPCEGPSLL